MAIKLDVRKIFAGSTTNDDARFVCGSYRVTFLFKFWEQSIFVMSNDKQVIIDTPTGITASIS